MGGARAYLGVARAPFLLLPVTLVVCGAGAAAFDGVFSLPRTLLALAGLVALHAAVNVLNEISDLRTGIDLETQRTPFSGGSGTLPSGRLTPRAAVGLAVACCLVGLTIGIWFLFKVGWPLVPVLVVGAMCVLAYTDLLARSGFGEVAAGLGLGALPVIGTALVQGGGLGPAAVAAAVPAFFMTFNLLLLNEFPDEAADRRGGRKNLVLLLGRRPAAVVYAVAAVTVPAVIAAASAAGVLPLPALVAALPSLALVPPLRWALGDQRSDVPVPALAANVVWNLATNGVLGVALALAALR